jgi:hypothetical protein
MPFAGAEDLNGLLNNPNGEFKIALGSGQGRYLHNDYDYSKGYWWSSFQKFAGTNLEKRGVIDLMLESYNNFVANAKEDYIDGRYKNLSFASVFPNQVRRLLSNMMQTDGLAFGPYVQVPSTMPKDNILTVQFLPWDRYDSVQTQNLDYPADTGNLKTTVLDPLVGWEQQYPGLVSAFIYGRTMLTMDVIDQMRIWTPNGIEGTYVADVDQLRFRDPVSGIVYAAKKYGTETVNSKLPAAEKAMGARMIQYANSLAAKAYNSTGTITDGTFTYPAYDTTTPKDYGSAQLLKGFVANLDHVRDLGHYMGFNPEGLTPSQGTGD